MLYTQKGGLRKPLFKFEVKDGNASCSGRFLSMKFWLYIVPDFRFFPAPSTQLSHSAQAFYLLGHIQGLDTSL